MLLPAFLFGGVSVATTLLRALIYGMIVFALMGALFTTEGIVNLLH